MQLVLPSFVVQPFVFLPNSFQIVSWTGSKVPLLRLEYYCVGAVLLLFLLVLLVPIYSVHSWLSIFLLFLVILYTALDKQFNTKENWFIEEMFAE